MTYRQQKRRARLHALNHCYHDLVNGEKASTTETLLEVTKKLAQDFEGGVNKTVTKAYTPGNVIVKCASEKFKPITTQ